MRLLALCLWALQPVGALLSNLQTEWLTAPLAIAAPSPRFTWLCDSATSYRVLVTQTFPPPLTPVWDSGAVAGSGNAAQYAGPPLAADADFELSVTCNSTASSTTATSTFSTAPTGAMLSQAVWIGGAPLLRTSIALPPNATPARARLCISGVGLYHAWVNGARVSAELSPGFSRSYYARLPYDCLDISALLQPGENAVGVETGSGKFHYMEYCDQTTNSAADCNAAIALVSLALAGSSSPAYYPSSPLTWRTARGGTLFEHLYHGEAHDARAEPLGWAAPGYNDSAWAPASAMPRMARFGPLAPSVAAPVVQDWSSPASTAPIFLSAQRSDLSYVMDFGSNRAGGCQLALEQLPAGTQLTLLHGEQLAGDGSVYDGFNFGSDQHCPNRNGGDCANQTMRYTARGGVGETFFPRFSYAGFRYVQLWGWPLPTPPPLTTVTCPALHTALQRTAGVAFPQSPRADAMVNALLRTHLSNLVSLPTDCPQRESACKGAAKWGGGAQHTTSRTPRTRSRHTTTQNALSERGWTGDGQLTSASAATWLHMAAFYENWVGAMAEQQTLGCAAMNGGRSSSCGAPIPGISYAGSLGDVAPLDGIGSMPGDPSWEVAAVVVPSVLLEAYGDVPFLNATFEQSPSAMLQFFTVMAATGTGAGAGLLPWSSLGDWKAIDFATPVLVANFHFLLAAQGVAALAAATGRPTDAAAALALAARISAALPGRFWNAARACWDEKCSQAAQVLSLVVGAGGEALAAPTRAALLAALPENASLTVGATGARYVFQALALAGRADIAAGLLLGEAYPSFGFMIEPLGAAPGTFWEDWGCNQKASCNSPGPNSTVGTSDNHVRSAVCLLLCWLPFHPPTRPS